MGVLKRRRASALGAAALVSIGAHVALVVAATSLPSADAAEAVVVDVVEIVDIVAPPDEPANAPAPPPPAPAAAKARTTPATLVATAPTPPREPEAAPSAPADDTPPEPSAPVVAAAEGATGGPAGDATRAVPGGVPGGLPGGIPGGTGTRPPSNEERRKHLFASYREQMRGRIGSGFRYPPEARDLELAGEVIVEVSVGRGGELRRVRLRGRCPHALLCDDALRTVRAAAPFAPLPPDLTGDPVQIDVPLNYAFE